MKMKEQNRMIKVIRSSQKVNMWRLSTFLFICTGMIFYVLEEAVFAYFMLAIGVMAFIAVIIEYNDANKLQG